MILMVLPLWSLWSIPHGSYGLPPYGPSGRLLMASFVSHLASRPCLGHQPLAHRGLPCCSIFSRDFPRLPLVSHLASGPCRAPRSFAPVVSRRFLFELSRLARCSCRTQCFLAHSDLPWSPVCGLPPCRMPVPCLAVPDMLCSPMVSRGPPWSPNLPIALAEPAIYAHHGLMWFPSP